MSWAALIPIVAQIIVALIGLWQNKQTADATETAAIAAALKDTLARIQAAAAAAKAVKNDPASIAGDPNNVDRPQ